MPRATCLAMILCAVFFEFGASPAAAQEPPADSNKSAAAAEAKPTPTKPKKVITNDDIKSSPFTDFGGVFHTNSGSINDCDTSCFDQVRTFASPPSESANWRREVLAQLDLVRSDAEWQGYLHQLFEAHNRMCQLTLDKNDEMRRTGTSRNMGPQQIEITEKYDQQMKAAQDQISALVSRQNALQKKFEAKRYAYAFATVQAMRMQSGFCMPGRIIYLQ